MSESQPTVPSHIEIPISRGVPSFVRLTVAFGIVIIFIIGGLCIGTSSSGHIWPSSDSTKVKLSIEPAAK